MSTKPTTPSRVVSRTHESPRIKGTQPGVRIACVHVHALLEVHAYAEHIGCLRYRNHCCCGGAGGRTPPLCRAVRLDEAYQHDGHHHESELGEPTHALEH